MIATIKIDMDINEMLFQDVEVEVFYTRENNFDGSSYVKVHEYCCSDTSLTPNEQKICNEKLDKYFEQIVTKINHYER